MKRKLITELDREMIIGQIKRLDLKKTYTVEITEKRVKRTISQNSLYWLWITCIAFETGNDKDDVHQLIKDKFITPINKNVLGNEIVTRTTTNLNTLQFKELLDKVEIFASTEQGIKLLHPEDQYWEEFYSFYSDKL